jgi:hypothetical protein
MKALIAVLVLALTTQIALAEQSKQGKKPRVESSRVAKSPRQATNSIPRLILGIGY